MARRRRKDIDDSPVSGDYTRDVVLNKDPDKDYAYVLPGDDMAKYLGHGFVRTERVEGSARPAYDEGGGDGGYTINGQLVLMEGPKGRAAEMQRRSEQRFAQQYNGNRDSIGQTRGSSLGSVGPDPHTPNSFRQTA